MAYKPEHAVDLNSGAVVAVEIHSADVGDTKTLGKTLKAAGANLSRVGMGPCPEAPAELVADKGYHSRAVFKELDGSPWKSRIAEPKRKRLNWWHGDHEARRAVYNNRIRLESGIGAEAAKLRTELAERSFQHSLDRGAMRKTWLRGQENVQKRYLMHIAGFNLGLLIRELTGYGTPKGAADAWDLIFVGIGAENRWMWLVFASHEDRPEEWLPFTVVSRVAG